MYKRLTYGCIVFYEDSNKILFHIVQRRDSLSYIYFIRGCVPREKLSMYFSRMTVEEKIRIQTSSFEDLWCDLYLSSQYLNSNYYLRAKEIFEEYRKDRLFENILSYSSIDLEWVIPKGRKKDPREINIICAQREYREETRSKCYLEFMDHTPLEYLNGDMLTLYYIAKSKYLTNPKHFNSIYGNICRSSISEETSNSRWVSFEEAKNYLSPNYLKILEEVLFIIKNQNPRFCTLQEIISSFTTPLHTTSPPTLPAISNE